LDLGLALGLAEAFFGLTSASSSSSPSLLAFVFEVEALPFLGLTSSAASSSPLAALPFLAAFLGFFGSSSSSSFSSTSGFLAVSGISSSSTACQWMSIELIDEAYHDLSRKLS
jgi:hypothetical protein